MDLIVNIKFDSPGCSRETGVFEVTAIEMHPLIYDTDDFEYALGIYEHPESFETFFKLYDPLDLVQLFFTYFDHSEDADDDNYIDRDHLVALSKHTSPKPAEQDMVIIDLQKIWSLDEPDTFYFMVPCLYDNNINNNPNFNNNIKIKREDVPRLYEGRYATLKEVLKAVNLAMGDPIPVVELIINKFEELEELEEF